MKKCPYCAEEIQDAAIVCRHCGRDLKPTETKAQIKKTKVNPKITLSCVGLLLLICLIGFIGSSISNATPQGKATATAKAQQNTQAAIATLTAPTSTPPIDSSIKAIMDGAGLSEKDATAAFEVIKKCGFKKVDKLEFYRETDNVKAYNASLGLTNSFMVFLAGNEIYAIANSNLKLYNKDQGGVLDKITNYILTDTEIYSFEQTTIENVKKALKAPSTAKFPGTIFEADQWSVGRNKDIVTVRSYVDAQNTFGAMIRSTFVMQYNYNTGEALYLEIDGEVIYGKAQ